MNGLREVKDPVLSTGLQLFEVHMAYRVIRRRALIRKVAIVAALDKNDAHVQAIRLAGFGPVMDLQIQVGPAVIPSLFEALA